MKSDNNGWDLVIIRVRAKSDNNGWDLVIDYKGWGERVIIMVGI